MAITRTQIAKQLLAQGGRTGFEGGGMLVKPRGDGKRPGYSVDTGDLGSEAANEAASASAAASGPTDGKGEGRDTDFQQRGMSKADYDKAVSRGDIGQNFSARPNFLSRFQNKTQNLSLKNIVDKRRGLKNPFSLNIVNPALDFYDDDDETSLMDTEYGMKGKDLTDISRAIDALDKGKTVGLSRNEYLDAFYGPNNPQDPRNKTERGDENIMLPPMMAQAPSIVEQESEEEEPFEMSRRFRAEGGIMNTDVVGGEMDFESARQMYGLGKLVKKVTKTVKKIAKSDIGKAALLYAGGSYLSALGAGSAGSGVGFGMFKPSAFASNLGMSLGKLGLGSKFIGPSQPKSLLDMVGGKVGVGILGASALAGALTPEQEEEAQLISDETGIDIAEIRANPNKYLARRFVAEGGSIKEPVAKKTMPLLDMDGQEMDLRAEGGFVPIGRMEKADDVPARLSKNEFVFTADAVRNAGEGNVDKGAEVMYNMMKNLESGGDVSEESQGLDGARKMFQTSQRLEEVL
jgi:hypothetical protein